MSTRSIPIYPRNLATFEESIIFWRPKRLFWTAVAAKRDMMWYYILRLSCRTLGQGRGKLDLLLDRLACLGIMGVHLRAHLKPLYTLVLLWSECFRGALNRNSMTPRDAVRETLVSWTATCPPVAELVTWMVLFRIVSSQTFPVRSLNLANSYLVHPSERCLSVS